MSDATPDPGYDDKFYRRGAKFVVAADGVEFHSAREMRPLKKGTRLECAGCIGFSDGCHLRFHGPFFWGWVTPCVGPLRVPAPGILEPATGNRRVRRKYLTPDANTLLERVSVLGRLPDECAAVRAILADKLQDDGRVADAVEQRALAGQGLAYYWVFPADDPGAAVGPFTSRQILIHWLNSITEHNRHGAVPASLFPGRSESDQPLPLSALRIVTCLMARTLTAVDPADEWRARSVLCPYGAVGLKLDLG